MHLIVIEHRNTGKEIVTAQLNLNSAQLELGLTR